VVEREPGLAGELPATTAYGKVSADPADPSGRASGFRSTRQQDATLQGLNIYKRSQGRYTRLITAVSVLVLAAWGCYSLSDTLYGRVSVFLSFGIPLTILIGVGAVTFWVLNRPASADFLIATEGEMKKVSWSSKKEVIGSTKVVIVTTFILAALLFLVDVAFANLFQFLGITPKAT
jgi:preprotein translocase subunit SecE